MSTTYIAKDVKSGSLIVNVYTPDGFLVKFAKLLISDNLYPGIVLSKPNQALGLIRRFQAKVKLLKFFPLLVVSF